MKIRIEDCRLFACGLTLLCLLQRTPAVAQRESTVNRDAEPEGPMAVPVDSAPRLEIARAFRSLAPPIIDEVQFPGRADCDFPLSEVVQKLGQRVEELIAI